MGEVKEVPVCPYCGAKMIEAGNTNYRWYMCSHCLSDSPKKIIDKMSYPTEQLAAIAALQEARTATIWYKPNHVLSFEELVSMAKEEPDGFPVWVEYNPRKATFYERGFSGWRILIKIYTWSNNDRTLMFNDDETVDYKNLGVAVRCWLRKPTQEEMEVVSWETK